MQFQIYMEIKNIYIIKTHPEEKMEIIIILKKEKLLRKIQHRKNGS